MMKYPMINRKPRREVSVPQFSGGLNLRDSMTGIRDNQMTECFNLWYKDGVLKSRPELQKTVCPLTLKNNNGKVKVFSEITYNERVLVGVSYIDENGMLNIAFYWQGKKDIMPVDVGSLRDESSIYSSDDEVNYFVIEKNGILYCYTNKFKIFKCDFQGESKEWNVVAKDEIYIPTILAHAKATNNGLLYKGTMFEGYNLLTKSYKMIYSTVNLEEVVDGETWMRYPYISKLPRGVDTTIIARLTNTDGKVCEHKAVWTGGKESRCFENINGESGDGLYLYVTALHVHFTIEKGSDVLARLKKEDFVEDNLEIEVIYSDDADVKNLNKVFKMTKSIWFGGTSNGINNGSRVFLCGNTDKNESSLVLWSALNNPLYFNENNYAYIGNKSEQVTAFGKQGENLVIFKPNEIYYSYYSLKNSIDAEDLINQTVVDYEANSVCFPMIQLNSGIGCDCSDSIQLCRNRLVWLNSDGNVYTLVSSNQYNEMTVYAVSGMVNKEICKYAKDKLKAATSHDFDGYYVLMIGGDAFVMDYNSYGYTHIYGYSKNEDANVLIPWYFWKLDAGGKENKFFGFKDFIFSFSAALQSDENFIFSILCNEKLPGFNEEKIKCSFATKLFDFMAANYFKNVNKVSIGIGNNGLETIKVSFVTDVGIESDTVTTGCNALDERDVNFIAVKNFHPTIYMVRNFGIKIESEGKLVVDGMSLQYKLLGGVK